MKYGIIYKWTNKINNKSYIGQTCNEESRKFDHLYPRVKSHFHSAILKYGADNFNYTVLEYNIPEYDLSDREIYWINFYDSYNNGYNMTMGGEGTRGFSNPCKEETKRKISIANKGKIAWNKGLKLKLEQIMVYTTGGHLSNETKEKISNKLKGRISPNKGNKLSDEAKEKISKRSKKLWENDEYRNKMIEVFNRPRKTKGIKRGPNKNHSKIMKNKIHINNGITSKMIDKELLNEYINNGWKRGRLMIKKTNKNE